MYDFRDIPREAAAHAVRISVDALDKIIKRHGAGVRRRGERLFSLRDLVVIKAARNLSGSTLPFVDALSIVAPHLAYEPPTDAVLIVTADDAWLQSRDAEWPECDCTLLTVGWIKQDILKRLEAA